jgi:hypothetical protein
MPSTITWGPEGIYARFVGACSIGDVTRVFDELSGDPCLDTARYAIFDYLEITAHDVTESDIEYAAALDIGLSFTNPRLLFASVTTDTRIRELWRHYISVNVKTERHGIFTTVAEARAWMAERNGQGAAL